jgi:hypothetical protein
LPPVYRDKCVEGWYYHRIVRSNDAEVKDERVRWDKMHASDYRGGIQEFTHFVGGLCTATMKMNILTALVEMQGDKVAHLLK